MRTPNSVPREARAGRSRGPWVLSFLAAACGLLGVAQPARAEFYWANPRPTGNSLGGVARDGATTAYAVGEHGTCLRTEDAGVSWELVSSPDALTPSLDDVLVTGAGALLAAGEAPGLFHSADGGATWTPIANPAGVRLRNLFRLDAATIFAVGDQGKVLRSTDDGVSFVLLGSAGSTLDDQYWRDSLNGIILGAFALRRTTDGGQTWLTIPGVSESGNFFGGDIEYFDANLGWIVNDFETYRTTNGGVTWTDLNHPIGNAPIYQDVCLALGPQTRLIATFGEGAEIWKTTNDGVSWSQRFEHDGSEGVADLERLPDGTILAVSSGADLLRSTDEGETWTNFVTVAGAPERATLEAADLLPGGLGFTGGQGFGWAQTTDGGATWFDPPATPGLNTVYAIAVRDAQFILAGGYGTPGQSYVRRTTDGGATWTTHSLFGSYAGYPQGLAVFSDGTCYCATWGSSGANRIFRSTDHGVTWQPRETGYPTSRRIFGLQFVDVQTGFVCGGDFGTPSLYRTTNGGAQWTAVGTTGLLIGTILDMHWFDQQTGLVVGDSRIQRTTNGGASWTTVVPSGPWGKVDFRDGSYGVATRLSGGVFITTDAGMTWTEQALPTSMSLGDVQTTTLGYLVFGTENGVLGWRENAAAVPTRSPAAGVTLWPNPLPLTAPRLHYRVDAGSRGAASLRFFDATGRLLASRAIRAEGEHAAGTIDLSGLSIGPGLVLWRMDAGGRMLGRGTLCVLR